MITTNSIKILVKSLLILLISLFYSMDGIGQNISDRLKTFESERVWSDEKIKYYLLEANPEAIQGEDLLQKGAEYLFFGQIDEALIYFKRYLAGDPENIAVISLVGTCYNLEQQYDSALVYFNKVIAEFPDYSELYCERGWVKIFLGDTTSGIRDIRYAYELDSSSYINTYNLALYYNLIGKADSSILLLDKAIKIEPELIQPHILKGEVFAAEGDHQGAIACYNDVIEMDSNFVGTYLLRGIEYLELYDVDKAVKDFQKLNLVGNDSIYFHIYISMHVLQDYRKAMFYYRKWIEEDTNTITKNFFRKVDGNEFTALLETIAVDSVNEGAVIPVEIAHAMYHLCEFEYDTSYYLMTNYLENYPDDVLAGRILMLSQFQRGEIQAAEETISWLVELDTNLVYANAMMADIMERQGNSQGALRYSRRALNKGPDYFWAWNVKAWALYMLRIYDESIEACHHAIALDPGKANAYNTRGLSYNALQQYDLAEKDFRKALEIDPDFCYSLGNLAMILINQGNYNDATYYAKKAVNQCPEMTQGYNQRARIYLYLKMPDLALADRSRIIELEPGNPENYYIRGNVYLQLNDDENAAADFEKAISLSQGIVWPYLRLGGIYMKQMKYDEAEKIFLKAITIDPGQEYPYTSLGFICRERYDNKESRKWFKKAIEINPQNDYALSYLGYIELVIGDYDKAYDYFQKAYSIEVNRGDKQFPMTEKLRYLIREDFKAEEARKILKGVYGMDE